MDSSSAAQRQRLSVEQQAFVKGWIGAADALKEPYPLSVFTPLTEDEVEAAVTAMNEAVPHASERMHAAWARHWSSVLFDQVREEISGV